MPLRSLDSAWSVCRRVTVSRGNLNEASLRRLISNRRSLVLTVQQIQTRSVLRDGERKSNHQDRFSTDRFCLRCCGLEFPTGIRPPGVVALHY